MSHSHTLTHTYLLFNVNRYIRVKRKNQTFCLLCAADDTFGTVKTRLASAFQQHDPDNSSSNSGMRLQLPSTDPAEAAAKILEDDVVVGSELKEDAVVHLVLAVSDSEWETVDIEFTDIQDAAA
jgi:hypothetical protein